MEYIFKWDENKAGVNLVKHKISFEEGKTIFYDPFILTFPDEFHSENEDRLISIGTSINQKLLLVVHLEKEITIEGVLIRIISCRKAMPTERKLYEEGE
jgi:uncharacterized DUF497 family protein